MIMFVSGFVVQFALKAFGGYAVAAYGVALRIEQILLLPVLGMTGALLPIAGQNFGALKFDRVQSIFGVTPFHHFAASPNLPLLSQ